MKKLLVSFLLGLTVFFSFAPNLSTAKADTTWYNQSFQQWYGKVYDPSNPGEIFGERYAAAQVQWIVYSLFSFLINSVTGPENSGLIQCFVSNVADATVCMDQLKDLLDAKKGQGQAPALVIAKATPQQNFWSLVFASDRPISGIAYVKEKIDKLNVVTVVQAQSVGVGFSALKPIQGMWMGFRNVSFGLFVIVAIVFAFMIMFRVKLSPQTVVSVQSALPKITISIILVTFSYAIAGFLIDLMYIAIGLVSLIGTQIINASGDGNSSATVWFNLLTLGQPAGFDIQMGAFGLLVLYLMLFCLASIFLLMLNVGAIGSAIVAMLAAIFVGVAIASGVWAILLIVAIIAAIIMYIIVLWMLFRILWGLLRAFTNVLLLTILAPIQLTLGTIVPSLGFGSWVRSYVSNLAVFVVTGALILFSYIFVAMGIRIGLESNVIEWLFGGGATGSLLGLVGQAVGENINAWPPLLGASGNAGVGLLMVIVSFVIFTLIPKANDIIQSLLSGKPFAYGSGIGEIAGAAGATLGTAGGLARSARESGVLTGHTGAERWAKGIETISGLVRRR